MNLCEANWAARFAPLGTTQNLPRLTFFLAGAPDPTIPIEIRVNSQPRPSSVAGVPVWSFDARLNAVTFVAD